MFAKPHQNHGFHKHQQNILMLFLGKLSPKVNKKKLAASFPKAQNIF
jgi:hypothetical protein